MTPGTYIPLEREEAHQLVAWLRLENLKFHHSPNETGSSAEAKRRAIRMKREGTSAGFLDYTILIPPDRSIDGEGYLIIIELKRQKGGRVSEAQQAWIDAINSLGTHNVQAYVAKGAEEAQNIVKHYLKPSSPF